MSNSNQANELSNPKFEKFERGEMSNPNQASEFPKSSQVSEFSNPNQVREFPKPNQASAF